MHEVGHGLAMTLSSEGLAHVHLGNKKDQNKRTFNIGRLHFHLKWSLFGLCSFEGKITKKQNILALIGGPLMSLILLLTFRFLSLTLQKGPLQLFAANTAMYNGVIFLSTALPVKYPRWMGLYSSMESDGLQILYLLRDKDTQSVKSTLEKDRK